MISVKKYTVTDFESLLSLRVDGWLVYAEAKTKDAVDLYIEEDDEEELVPIFIHIVADGQEVQPDWAYAYSCRIPFYGVRHIYMDPS